MNSQTMVKAKKFRSLFQYFNKTKPPFGDFKILYASTKSTFVSNVSATDIVMCGGTEMGTDRDLHDYPLPIC